MDGHDIKSNSFKLIIMVALLEEAKPLIDQLNLRELKTSVLKAFQNDWILLVVSGIGFNAMTLAVGYAAGLASNSLHLFWLNLGSAGHRDYLIGTVVLPAKIRNSEEKSVFYPTAIIPGTFKRDELISLESPSQKYLKNMCFDMEAFAFCNAASRFSVNDYIQVLKIVSDNEQNPVTKMKKGALKSAMSLGLMKTLSILQKLRTFAEREVAQKESKNMTYSDNELHFSETQKLQFFRLSSLLHLLDPRFNVLEETKQHKTPAAALDSLEAHIQLYQTEIIND